jgi:hypothetical protein
MGVMPVRFPMMLILTESGVEHANHFPLDLGWHIHRSLLSSPARASQRINGPRTALILALLVVVSRLLTDDLSRPFGPLPSF